MAGESSKVSGSPEEDFNPLAEYGEFQAEERGKYHHMGEYRDISPQNSLDSEPGVSLEYGITPPNIRHIKRVKEKSRADKQVKVSKQDMKGDVDAQRVSKFKTAKRSSSLRTSISEEKETEEAPDEDMEPLFTKPREIQRKKTPGKVFMKSRKFDRDYKWSSTSSEYSAGTSEHVVSRTLEPLKIDSPNQYKCLNSHHIRSNSQGSSFTPDETPRSFQGPSNCPKDRMDFFKVFSMLVNLGGDKKRKDTGPSGRGGHMSRQMSTDQEVWQNIINDVIWLDLQAWHQGITKEELDNLFVDARQRVPGVLEEVLSFRFNCDEARLGSVSVDLIDENGVQNGESSNQKLNMGKFGGLCGGKNLKDTLCQQRDAMNQVSNLLNKLEEVEQLYPTLKALARDHPSYGADRFQHRLNTLCLWLNITREIGHKLNLMGKHLHIDKLPLCEGGKECMIYWPWASSEEEETGLKHDPSTSTLAPEICVEDCDSLGSGEEAMEEDQDYSRTVQFNVDEPITPDEEYDSVSLATPNDKSTPKTSASGRTLIGSAIALSRNWSNISFEEYANSMTSIYRYYVDKSLKKYGLRRVLVRLNNSLNSVLIRAKQALEKPKSQMSYAQVVGNELKETSINPDLLASSPSFESFLGGNLQTPLHDTFPDRRCSLAVHGAWSEEFKEMGLPSFRPTYLFLVRIPLDVIHECLRLRLEQTPKSDPSSLSIEQLIRECKEVLYGGVMVKQYYHRMVHAVIEETEVDLDIESFDADMKEMLERYFEYIQTWTCSLQNMKEMSKRLKNNLEDEWQFTKQVCPHVIGGEANAGKRFSLMASSMLHSISDFLDNGMDECLNQLYDSTMFEGSDDPLIPRKNNRQQIIQTCRHFKDHFREARERSSKALGFAKMLKKDLEIAADFNIDGSEEGLKQLFQRLRDTQHVRLKEPTQAGFLMFVPESLQDNSPEIIKLLDVTTGRGDILKSVTSQEESYLLLVRCQSLSASGSVVPKWEGAMMVLEYTAEITIALSHIVVEGLLLVVSQSTHLATQLNCFQEKVGPVIQLVNEQTSCHQAIAESLQELKNEAMNLRDKVALSVEQVTEKLNVGDNQDMDEQENKQEKNIELYKEILDQCYNFSFEYHREVSRLVSGQYRIKLGVQSIDLAKQWMKFVLDRKDRGRGRRPRWANQGLEFLLVACEPRYTGHLSDSEFAELKYDINKCLQHIVGDKTSGASSPGTGYRVNSPDVTKQGYSRIVSWPETSHNKSRSLTPSRTANSEPPTPSFPGLNHSESYSSAFSTSSTENMMPINRVQRRIEELEEKLVTKLHRNRVIGQVTTHRSIEQEFHINVRRARFKWQRGFKIGEGQFGKVYTAVNMDTGAFMAMKEIKFPRNDLQAIKAIADEVNTFETIKHKHLVEYYGVEVHRDEMLIFMEYCAEGTLEGAAKTGLPEPMIRQYSYELILAVNTLHEHQIVHRDIKGANIFLTKHGLKLGDFGCSVKLKMHTTQQGEITFAGTIAYMAPEAFTGFDNFGRMSDIWSVGCVVLEMITGKRPWHEYETDYAIMYKVGSGGMPTIPENLNDEARDFLDSCFQHNARDRKPAHQLLNFAFVKVTMSYDDDIGGDDSQV